MKPDEQVVTLVTRNDKHEPWKVVAELVITVGLIYYASHPEIVDELGEKLRERWNRLVHQLSVWQTLAAIRSLPELDDQE